MAPLQGSLAGSSALLSFPASRRLSGSCEALLAAQVDFSTRTTCRASPASTSAHAAVAVDRLPLSSYKFPHIPGVLAHQSLETAVKDAVAHLEQAPFLQLQRGRQSKRHKVDDSLLAEPKVWESIAARLRQDDTELVMLVHPLDPVSQDRAARSVPSSGEVLSGITSAGQRSRLLSFAELVRAGRTTADFSGHVGECCDEEPHSQVVPFHRRQHHAREREATAGGQAHADQTFSGRFDKEPARLWGVVLQSADHREAGCYVLKTCHSAVGDCTCVHWSLTRVRSGASLYDQLSSAWLVA